MREHFHHDWFQGKAHGHKFLSPTRRKGGGCEASSFGYDIRNSQVQGAGPCKGTPEYRVPAHWHWTGPNKKAETGRNQADRGSEPNEQRRIDGTGQGKKLEVGRNRPERRKTISEDAGQRERRNARRPVGQGGQRERTRDLDTGEGEESEAGRGNGGGQREASEDQNKTITVLYTNAQSIGSKIDELKAITQELEPDIILLTETWRNNSVGNAALSLENYKLETELRKDRCDTANGVGGGLLVYSRDNLQILPSDLTDRNFNQFCSFTIATKSEKLNVILIYRPPSSGQNSLTELCEIVRKADNNTVIIGDFNLPGTDWANERSDLKGRELLDTVQEEGFEQLVSFPTHTKGNILDLVLSNCPEKKLDIEDVGRLGRSDHCMLKVVIEFNRAPQ
jgi:hypothetical protein